MARKPITVTLSLDVEEEGLFSGQYGRLSPSLKNAAHLKALSPLLERGVKPTLFCAWPVFEQPQARKAVDELRNRYPLETGCHLHYWNTPPLVEGPDPERAPVFSKVATARIDPVILKAKLKRLLALADDFNGAPTTSFRMGKWDLHSVHWPLLSACGIKCDASVRPLHAGRQADKPDHFEAPHDPYRLANQFGSIFEVPLTVASWLPFMEKLKNNSFAASLIKPGFQKWGALPLLAIEYPLPILKLVSMLHIGRGGANLSLTWHSSEMMPGGAPHMPDAAHVKKFLKKMEAYLEWLESQFEVQYETMDSLRRKMENSVPSIAQGEGDWNFPPEEIFDMEGQDVRIN